MKENSYKTKEPPLIQNFQILNYKSCQLLVRLDGNY